jgi:hypothetical protein
VLEDLASIGWRPTLIGIVVLVIGAIAGWGMAGDRAFAPARWLRWWLERIILPGLRQGSWLGRALMIFLNNAAICALLILAGGLPAGAWVAVVVVGLSLGAAMRMLTDPRWDVSIPPELGEAEDPASEVSDDGAPPAGLDRVASLGVLLNLLELPAIAIALGLTMGRLAVPNNLVPTDIWRIYASWVAPLLVVAAAGESLWIGRRRPF